jgi:hypothetical protein
MTLVFNFFFSEPFNFIILMRVLAFIYVSFVLIRQISFQKRRELTDFYKNKKCYGLTVVI